MEQGSKNTGGRELTTEGPALLCLRLLLLCWCIGVSVTLLDAFLFVFDIFMLTDTTFLDCCDSKGTMYG